MKRSKFILFGSIGLVTVTALVVASTFVFNEKGAYEKNDLTFLKNQSAEDAQKWLEARYFDAETGEKISDEKLRAIEKAVANAPQNKAINLDWTEQGPDNIGGRTRAVLIDRTNINRIFAGSVSGGLFVSTTRANQWTKIESYPGSKFISSMAQTQNGAIFVATGSSNEGWNGNGVFYTTDFGTTWNTVPGTTGFNKVTEIGCADNSNTLFMATNQGMKKWVFGATSLATDPAGISGSVNSLQVSKDGTVLVASNGVLNTFVSTDGGATFSNKTGSGSNQVESNCQRIEYAISPIKNTAGKYTIYAVRTTGNLAGMHVSSDNGQNWSKFIGASGTPSNLDIYRNQGTYNSIVSVRPDDTESILIGGIDIWKWKQQTSNPVSGGFEKQSQWFLQPTNPKYVHADNHEMKWDNTNRLYVGNDGGIGISGNFGASWYPANRGYNVTQFYGIAFDRDGSVMGGAQDNGTLYNNHQGNTYKEFVEVNGGDGFECEISFFNPKVMFSTIYYNALSRSADGGKSFGAFSPPYPTNYGTVGSSSAAFPFHTEMFLAENYDLDSKDSITFFPKKDYSINSKVRVASASTGDTITFNAPINLYFDDTVNYFPALTETRYSVVNKINQQLVYLDNYNYTPYASASQQYPPLVNDSLYVDFPNGTQTVVVQSVDTYKWYFAKNSQSNKVIELGFDSVRYAISWDTLRVPDPFQSWLVIYTAANGGEVWGTRDALRLSKSNPVWVLIAKNLGGNVFSSIDMEFTRDLSSMFISTGAKVNRIDGLGVYTSESDFASRVGYHGGLGSPTPPTGISTKEVYVGTSEGIALNPNNANDLIVMPGNSVMKRSLNALATNPTFNNLMPLLPSSSPFVYDGIIDREDSDLLVVGTSSGVFTSDNGGTTWSYNSNGFEGTPVYEVRQNWRSFSEGNNRPGEIYIGTFGRGIWSSASVLGLSENNAKSEKVLKNKLKMFPNPTSNNTSISYSLNTEAKVTIQVYSVTGALVKSIDLNKVSKGEHTYSIDASSLQRGTYIVRLNAGGQTETTKFIKQ
ncbi:MAG: T9SS type A sorting domain-containing protein [Bacteroidetes bacterium]|nr:T9SS type A sorting domain-containing protein [Bacteroidota bacterium]